MTSMLRQLQKVFSVQNIMLIHDYLKMSKDENLYGPWGGNIKKRAAEKKSSTPPVAYIMNAALACPSKVTRMCP